ncbi:hypothetical protein FOL46_008664 [Perkinsus olseni]|uniref:MULE transposase domain-containing protein n=1 Tax=Perkinsus olseni TaxID=32597 RepID=A0A7J6L607_PEROL|nr:hypothetical protein FOL46_008664 [Perkinsus olseni]
MADKSQESYLKVFRVLRDFLKLNIASVMLDFESAAVKAFQQVFPTTVVKLCYFHLAQNWWKQFRIVHNASKEVVKVCYYKLLCIVFLPAELICSAILYALADLPTGDRQRILQYVLRNYVEGRVAKPQLWLMKERVQAALPRTNNNQEGFHYRWNSSFGEHKERPSFYVWVLSVHSMMLETHLELVRLNAGHAPSRPPKYDYDDIILSSLCAQDVTALSVKSWVDSAVNVTNGGNDTVVDVSSSEGIAEATGEVGPTPKKRRGASEQSTQNASTPWTSLTSRQGGRLSVTLENRQELLTTGSMIPDDIVDIWMEMLCQEAQIRSPQKVAVGTSSFGFQPVPASVLHSGELYVQPIIDPARQHFAATAVVDGQVYFMDSMNVHLPHDGFFVQAMRQLYGSSEVLNVAVQQQEYGSNTCGLHAVARLTEVVLNRQWFTLTVFEESRMRYHAAQCISSGRVLRFPEVFPAPPSMAFGPEGRIVI